MLPNQITAFLEDCSIHESNLLKNSRRGLKTEIEDGSLPDTIKDIAEIRPHVLEQILLHAKLFKISSHGLHLKGALITGDINLTGSDVDVPIVFENCNIRGRILLRAARLRSLAILGSSAKGIEGDGLTLENGLQLSKDFSCSGSINLNCAKIYGNIEINSSKLSGHQGLSLAMVGAEVSGSIFIVGTESSGEVNFSNSRISGNLECSNSIFRMAKNQRVAFNSLSCDNVDVKGSVFLNDDFYSEGEVRFPYGKIGGSLDCRAAVLVGLGGHSLNCTGVEVRGDVRLGTMIDWKDGAESGHRHFRANGFIDFSGCSVRGNFDIAKSSMLGNRSPTATFSGATVTGQLIIGDSLWTNQESYLDFSQVNVGVLNQNLTSESIAQFNMDGLRYNALAGNEINHRTMLRWLERQPSFHLNDDFRPQPWEQAARILREIGHTSDANLIAIAKQERLRQCGKLNNKAYYPLHLMYGAAAGYGYRPVNLVGAMLFVWLVCSGIYSDAASRGMIGPTSAIINSDRDIFGVCRDFVVDIGLSPDKSKLFDVSVRSPEQPLAFSVSRPLTQWTACSALPQEYTTFSSLMYSADLILPLVNLQQEEDWAPIVTESNGFTYVPFGVFTRIVMWAQILFGWTASLLLVAVLSNLIKKD